MEHESITLGAGPIEASPGSSDTIARFITAVRESIPAVIHEFNTVRLPALETAWGRSFEEEWTHEDPKQKTQEVTKVFTRILNNVLYAALKVRMPTFKEFGTVGSDFTVDDIPVEDKNSFSTSDTWTGNGYKKTDWHLLKKFQINARGQITDCFAAIVNLSACKSKWTEPTLSSNFSSLHLLSEDHTNITVICGSLVPKKKYLSVALQQIGETPN